MRFLYDFVEVRKGAGGPSEIEALVFFSGRREFWVPQTWC